MRLLHIDASPRSERSRSRVIAQAYLEGLAEVHPDLEVYSRNVWEMDLPTLGGDMIEERYALIMGQPVSEAAEQEWQNIATHVEHFLSYDAWCFSVPMWNFGIPYPLKHYIDVITQPRMLFSNDSTGAVTGHAAGKKAVVIAASAMDIQPGGPLEALDFQLRYLESWLAFIGATVGGTIRVAPTFGAEEAVQSAMAEATHTAHLLAKNGLG